MPSISRVLALASAIAVASANAIPPNLKRAVDADCATPTVVATASIPVGDKFIEFKTLSCAAEAKRDVGLNKRTLYDQLTCEFYGTCPTPSSTTPESVCGASCSITCSSDAGILPPISEDCDVIKNAIQIFSPNIRDTFEVAANTIETLSYGTCAYFFKNTHTSNLDYCWSEFSKTAPAAGKGCFPPVQPIKSQGLCSAADGRWAVGAAHS